MEHGQMDTEVEGPAKGHSCRLKGCWQANLAADLASNVQTSSILRGCLDTMCIRLPAVCHFVLAAHEALQGAKAE